MSPSMAARPAVITMAGSGGNSSLYGGAGIVTLVGAANGDTLTANGYSIRLGTGNAFFGGSGTELMTASASTGNNLFEVGYNYPGLATPPDGNGTISSCRFGRAELLPRQGDRRDDHRLDRGHRQ